MSLREAVVYYYCIPEASKRVPIFPFEVVYPNLLGGRRAGAEGRKRSNFVKQKAEQPHWEACVGG
jgi:hypothetical protein